MLYDLIPVVLRTYSLFTVSFYDTDTITVNFRNTLLNRAKIGSETFCEMRITGQ
jgi:hypothetical protein